MTPTAAFRFDNSYARELPGCYAACRPAPAPEPRLLFLNRTLAQALGLDDDALDGPAGAALFAGNALPEGAQPIAQAYAGHQFGGFSPVLGDGRTHLLGQIATRIVIMRTTKHGTPAPLGWVFGRRDDLTRFAR